MRRMLPAGRDHRRDAPAARTVCQPWWSSGLPRPLDDLQVVQAWQRREGRVRLSLVPEGGRCDVILQRQIAHLPVQARAPAKRLDRHPQVPLEADGVHDMPAIHAEALLAHVETVRLDYLREAEIGG